MLVPMGILAGVCLVIGLAPVVVIPFRESAVSAWLPPSSQTLSLHGTAPLGWISVLGVALVAVTLLTTFWYRGGVKKAHVATSATWGCGYIAPTSRMQYVNRLSTLTRHRRPC